MASVGAAAGEQRRLLQTGMDFFPIITPWIDKAGDGND
jgi:predicted oxidoreductase